MMEKLLGRSWGILAIAVLFASAVSAQDLARLESFGASSNGQPGETKQTLEVAQERTITGTIDSDSITRNDAKPTLLFLLPPLGSLCTKNNV